MREKVEFNPDDHVKLPGDDQSFVKKEVKREWLSAKEEAEASGAKPEEILEKRAYEDDLEYEFMLRIERIRKFNTGSNYGPFAMQNYDKGDPMLFLESLREAKKLLEELSSKEVKTNDAAKEHYIRELEYAVFASVSNMKYNIERDCSNQKDFLAITEAAIKNSSFYEAIVGFQKFFKDNGYGESEDLSKIIEAVEEARKVRGNNS